jgi:hypothetical protein
MMESIKALLVTCDPLSTKTKLEYVRFNYLIRILYI